MMLKRLFACLFAGLFGGASYAADEPIKVLFIGNSYTHMNEMPKMFEKIAKASNKKVLVKKSALSGASFKVHSEREDIYPDIRSEKWDYVILQGYSREFTWDTAHIEQETIPYLEKIMDSIYTNNPFTNILFYHTWGYESGYEEREETNTYDKMTDRVKAGYMYVGEKYNLPVVPVGQVWREVKKDSTIDLYYEDRAHPSKNGSYLIATTFFDAIFGETTEGLKVNIIDNADQEIINRKAYEFVTQYEDEYRLSSRRFFVEKTSNKKYKFSSTFPKAEQTTWMLDDKTLGDVDSGEFKLTNNKEHQFSLFVKTIDGQEYSISRTLQRERRCRLFKRKEEA